MTGGIVIVDKPKGWTSHDVVGKLRRLFGERRIGHAGTLDPMATGVLPVFVGRATRAVEFMEGADKEYLAGIKFGLETDTQDISGNIVSESDCRITADELAAALEKFTGEIQQVPPMYSAIKINGKKLYELARQGIEVERKPRPIQINELRLISGTENEFSILASVSKGTYVRTLCHDIGRYLGTGAVMTSLRRTRVGEYGESEAVSMEELIAASQAGRAREYLRPVDSMFIKYPTITANAAEEKNCRNGGGFPTRLKDGSYRIYSQEGEFLMLGKCENGYVSTIKSFFDV